MNKEELERENEKLHERIKELEDENKELKKILTIFINPHTPPSKQEFFPKTKTISTKKLGAPWGHNGATRTTPQPKDTLKHFLTFCPKCKWSLDNLFEIEEKIVEEIPEPQPVKVTRHLIGHYNCKNCGAVTAEIDLPKEGNFGKNLLTQVALMKYEDRLPARKLTNTLERHYRLNVTHSTILNMVQRVVRCARNIYEQIKLKIRQAFNVYIDETSLKVQGKKFWIWIFTTLNETFFAIRQSRHCKIVDEVLGENFEGVINCDGWETYKTYKNKNGKVFLQRCWAHALREVDAVAEKYSEVTSLAKWFHDVFIKVCEAREKKLPRYKRERLKEKYETELRRWLNVAKPYKELKTVRTKIENGFEYWFTCVLYPEVEPTNNRAERGLREEVVLRKITGTLRNEKGTVANEVLMSLITTWKQRGLNSFQELRALL